MLKQNHNPWIPIADMLSSVVLVLLILFILAVIVPRYHQEEQKRQAFEQIETSLADYKEKGFIHIDLESGVIELTDLTFDTGSAIINSPTQPLVQELGQKLKPYLDSNAQLNIMIEGHTDPAPVTQMVHSGGYYETNIQLSTLRAASVRQSILDVLGGAYASRIGVAGYGETRLKNQVNQMASENRRVEIRFIFNGQANQSSSSSAFSG